MLYLKTGKLNEFKMDAVIIPVSEDSQIHDNETIISLIKKTDTAVEFKGAKGDELTLYDLPEIKSQRVMFLGLGKIKNIDYESLRAVCGKSVKKCIKDKLKDIIIAVPSSVKLGMERKEVLESMAEGAFLANHIFDKYKKEKKYTPLKKVNFFVEQKSEEKYEDLLSRVEIICSGTILAREWVSTPSNDKVPDVLSKNIALAAKNENLKIKIFDEKKLKQLGFGALLAVAKGSENKPRLIILEYSPKGAKKTIALIGKGI
ncbi:MAG: hypothetical protein FP814_07075, partial [Desulfobacterium sp.]|nr:hypothetical protein [Desulfobacterium sp.]MBU4037002.1 hypothetical protein [Pseudomonadota bacterium]